MLELCDCPDLAFHWWLTVGKRQFAAAPELAR
jgi:hypothetical protein